MGWWKQVGGSLLQVTGRRRWAWWSSPPARPTPPSAAVMRASARRRCTSFMLCSPLPVADSAPLTTAHWRRCRRRRRRGRRWVGRWITADSVQRCVPQLLLIPCLAATLFVGEWVEMEVHLSGESTGGSCAVCVRVASGTGIWVSGPWCEWGEAARTVVLMPMPLLVMMPRVVYRPSAQRAQCGFGTPPSRRAPTSGPCGPFSVRGCTQLRRRTATCDAS